MQQKEHNSSITYNFKENVSFALTYRNINQTDLAKLLSTTRRIVSNWFNSDANIPLEMMVEISNILKIDLNILIFADKKDVEKSLSGYTIFVGDGFGVEPKEVAEQDQQYQPGINKLTPEKVEQLLSDPDNMVQIIRGFTSKHEEFMKDPIYQLYVGRIINDYRIEETNKESREMANADKKSGLAKG